jgi:hypothetical protein
VCIERVELGRRSEARKPELALIATGPKTRHVDGASSQLYSTRRTSASPRLAFTLISALPSAQRFPIGFHLANEYLSTGLDTKLVEGLPGVDEHAETGIGNWTVTTPSRTINSSPFPLAGRML